MATRKSKPEAPPSLGAPSIATRTVTLTVHRPHGNTTTVQGIDISLAVAGDGALLIVSANGKSYTAFAAGQWLTVGTPPVQPS